MNMTPRPLPTHDDRRPYRVFKGWPSWHQAHAGHSCAAVATHSWTSAERDRFSANSARLRPHEPVYIQPLFTEL